MGKILVIGANGSVGKSCVNNLKDDCLLYTSDAADDP